MKYFLYILIILLFIGCASEKPNRTNAQFLTPDKFKMQLNYNTDDFDTKDGHDDLDQIRFGLDWNL